MANLGQKWLDLNNPFKWFGGGQDPNKQANKYYDQIPGQVSPYYNPYIQAGQDQLPKYQDQLNKLMQDPNSVYQMLGQNYQQSPGFQFKLNQGINAANNAAAAGGMLGSPAHQYETANVAEGIANQDFNDYLGNMMNLYGQGLQGSQGLQSQGLQAGSSLADLLGNNLAAKGNNAFTSTRDQNQRANQLLLALLQGGASFASGGMGGWK